MQNQGNNTEKDKVEQAQSGQNPQAAEQVDEARAPDGGASEKAAENAVMTNGSEQLPSKPNPYADMVGSIESGDKKLAEPIKPKPESIEAKAERIGYPPRPHLWPPCMAWPVQPQFDLLAEKVKSPQQAQAYYKFLEEQEKLMLERAKTVHKFIMEHNDPFDPSKKRTVAFMDFRSRLTRHAQAHLNAHQAEPHYGVRWASLLDQNAVTAAANLVTEWGHAHARTKDGGAVLADEHGIRFQKITEMSIRLAVHEGMSRGWGEFKMTGNPQFCKAAIEAARESNIKATIVERYGFLNLGKRVHTVMPAPPGVDRDATVDTKEEQTPPQNGLPRSDPGPLPQGQRPDPSHSGPMGGPGPDMPHDDQGYRFDDRDYGFDDRDYGFDDRNYGPPNDQMDERNSGYGEREYDRSEFVPEPGQEAAPGAHYLVEDHESNGSAFDAEDDAMDGPQPFTVTG